LISFDFLGDFRLPAPPPHTDPSNGKAVARDGVRQAICAKNVIELRWEVARRLACRRVVARGQQPGRDAAEPVNQGLW
jgi:hypothetical protein